MNKEEFIIKARKIHGDKYDYSNVEYVNTKVKVCIVCPEHGEFWQTPYNHLMGRGCPKCAWSRVKLTSEEFINKAKEIHVDKYDYSNVNYINSHTKVCIICPEHGEFWQTPNSHLSGSGCPLCGHKNSSEKQLKSINIFIKQAKEIHGDKYDYSKVKYVNNITKICIICPEHGEFWQRPTSHLKGFGCKKCSGMFLDKNTFIERATLKHNGKYDYSKVEYVNNQTKVCIICPEHGEFWQNPSSHLKGVGCRKCIQPNAYMSNEEFIAKSKEVHGDKYDYSKVVYKGIVKKVIIICPEHGDFLQSPRHHLRGHNCPKCSGCEKSNTDEFIKKAQLIHGNKYDYSETVYITAAKKVKIICPLHGEFYMTGNNHLRGQGCPKCANNVKLETSEFIEKAQAIHGNKYDYSKVNYVNRHTEVCIICPECGEFQQTPNSHLAGNGCPKCKGWVFNTEDFIDKAKKVHGDKYDYSETVYIAAAKKVKIICPKHGEFWQTPNKHLCGCGCPKCNMSHLENNTMRILEHYNIEYECQKKFKWSKRYRYDFYLPTLNVVIECQGVQHFKPTDFASKGEEWANNQFKKIIKNDKIKKDLCNDNNVGIHYINYYDENIEDKIKKLIIEYDNKNNKLC